MNLMDLTAAAMQNLMLSEPDNRRQEEDDTSAVELYQDRVADPAS